ncbi:GYDIA family GHMP kinase [Robiginitalea sp. IMCC44478]|uniref:GYDIA family GHMP kinase n=1 Tax=Robiginitalea sp. IMCC44478 TaxID=3459122 RepID=UPI0040433B94
MEKEFYSHGKLLLSGEYLVLDGARALALPCRFGQWLRTETLTEPVIHWVSLDHEKKVWFETTIPKASLEKSVSGQPFPREISQRLIYFLRQARRLNPQFLSDPNGVRVTTLLEFPRKWGLGSSSTLISNLARWAEINPYDLLAGSMGGSGYDLACATASSPVFYRLDPKSPPMVEPAAFDPPFSEQLFFVFLNDKQDSGEAIRRYRKKKFDRSKMVLEISGISEALVKATELNDFETLLARHEELLSEVLDLPPVKQSRFADFPGSIKSLGAWGGDFVLATGREEAQQYFIKKGYPTVIPYAQMIL